MIYLDYAANTPVCQDVLEQFTKIEYENPFNPNSNNPLAENTRNILKNGLKKVANLLSVKEDEVIFTSSATESNNLAIKGIAQQYKNRGKHIISTYLEHSSVNGAISHLIQEGFEVDYVSINSNGVIDFDHLKELLRKDTILVSISHVDSEMGLIQPINDISDIIKKHSNSFFHVDGTQAVGKIDVNLENIDCYSFSAHKFYGLNGCGGLILKEGIMLEPLLHGGLSYTPFRSGTPPVALISSTAMAMEIAITHLEERLNYVQTLNKALRDGFSGYKDVCINSLATASPFILNISIPTINSETIKNQLAREGICLSTKSACCAVNTPSRPVYALTKNKKVALSTLRISLSHLTTKKEIELFLDTFNRIYNELT